MSIYAELVRIGMTDAAAGELLEAVHYSRGLATKEDLAKLESSILRSVQTTMAVMTGIFATFVGALAWVLAR